MATHSNILAWKMERGAWRAIVHGVAKSRTQLINNSLRFADGKQTPRG